jgi:L-alanine-DL-glutamate epimerase-like enolase superfamily enzyme
LEYIPWLRDWMQEPAKIEGGFYAAPQAPGAGMTPSRKALETINMI